MERPPKKYVCEKCGYLGDTSEHEGCDYLAWTTGEQLCIDQLERELALLKASPVGAPEGWKLVPVVPTHAILDVMFDAGIDRHDGDLTILYRAILAAAPTPPVSEDRWLPIETAPKDEFVLLAGPSGYTTIETVFSTGRMCSDYHVGRWIDHANDDLTDWGFEPTHWMPLPKAPTMQEDKKP